MSPVSSQRALKEGSRKDSQRCEDAVLLAWKIQEGAMRQGMQAAAAAGKDKGIDPPLEPPKGISPAT